MAYEPSALPYPYDALEPHIDTRTMEIHHTKHHAAYCAKLSAALEGHANLLGKTAEDLLQNIKTVPENLRQVVIDHGGGHANHTLFWRVMGPNKGGEPRGSVAAEIQKTWGGFDKFRTEFANAAATRFGSGWAWLALNENGKLYITSTPNQNSLLMQGHRPILGLDVWEHAYYLKYQNRRPDYIAAWWNIVNWDMVQELYDAARG